MVNKIFIAKFNKNLDECATIKYKFVVIASPPKRFYKDTGILSCDGKYEITLDSKKLKTPSGAVFQVPNEPLAIAGM